MEYLIGGLCIVVIVALLAGIASYSKSQKKQSQTREKNLVPVRCPLCNSELYKGENLVSKVYRPMNVSDQLMTVSGCPHCYPKCEPGVKRLCPVCHKDVALNETLTARLFNKSAGKKHVHIVGCTKCHKARSENY